MVDVSDYKSAVMAKHRVPTYHHVSVIQERQRLVHLVPKSNLVALQRSLRALISRRKV